MSIRLLRVGLLGVAAWLVAAGCGGKVAIDQPGAGAGGNGGAGGATSTDVTVTNDVSATVTTAVTVGPTTTGTGGGPEQPCIDCVNDSVGNVCSNQAEACSNNPECAANLDCQQSCGWNQPCKQKCAEAHPTGAAAFTALMECTICQACGSQCPGTPFYATFCFLPP
jgi:hypothetical protein